MNNEKRIGEIIRALRGNESLRDFAQKCDTSHTTIDNLEKGIDFRTGKPTQVKMATLEKIAKACDLPFECFVINEKNSKNRLRATRLGNCKTIEQVTTDLNIPIKTYLLWENLSTIPNQYIDVFSKYFNIPRDYLLDKPYEIKRKPSSWYKDEQEDYENGDESLKEFLNFTLGEGEFIETTEQKEKPTAEGDRLLSEAIDLMKKLSSEDQAQALKYLAFLAENSDK